MTLIMHDRRNRPEEPSRSRIRFYARPLAADLAAVMAGRPMSLQTSRGLCEHHR
jgi:hypothetical protein